MADDLRGVSDKAIRGLLRRTQRSHQPTIDRMRVRRLLVNRIDSPKDASSIGTHVPAPFDKSSLVIKAMLGEPAKAVQHYAGRMATNRPTIEVRPMTTKRELTDTIHKTAASQELLDTYLWESVGGRKKQWQCGWAQGITGAAVYVSTPRDATFGLPDRRYFEDGDEEAEMMRREGKLSRVQMAHPKTGQRMYAEHPSEWRKRRIKALEQEAVSGRGLFVLDVYPRDQVLWDDDHDSDVLGPKWIATIEEIEADECGPGTEIGRYAALRSGIEDAEQIAKYGLMVGVDGKSVIGGISRGGPKGATPKQASTFLLVTFHSRCETVVLISATADFEGAKEVYRGEHDCEIDGQPANPAVIVPMMTTDVHTPGMEFSTPLEQVFAYVPQINELLTFKSLADSYNGAPRWVIELADGTLLRGDDGEPVVVQADSAPGLDPKNAPAYPGTVKQLVIDTKSLEASLSVYFERLDASMPAPVTFGESGTSAPAWQVHQLIQQAQENLRQGVDHHTAGVKAITQRWHSWMRDLGLPVRFFPVDPSRENGRYLVEFDPKDLTDSIEVTQFLETPDEATARQQQGIELRREGVIDDYQYFEDYQREQDAEGAIDRMYVQKLVDYVMFGVLPPVPEGAQPGELPIFKLIGDGIRGRLHTELIQRSPNYAIAQAQAIAAQAQAASMQNATMPDENGNVMEPMGMGLPGLGMAPTLEGQIGTNRPTEAPPMPAGG